MVGIILILIGLFFFCDTVLPEKYKKKRYRHWYHIIPGSYTILFLYDYLIRGVRWNPDYKPSHVNFKVTKEEVLMYVFTELGKFGEKIESSFDIKILDYGTPEGSNVFNIQFKVKLDGKWKYQGLAVQEDQFLKWLNQ